MTQSVFTQKQHLNLAYCYNTGSFIVFERVEANSRFLISNSLSLNLYVPYSCIKEHYCNYATNQQMYFDKILYTNIYQHVSVASATIIRV
jgi:hypothetical protein